VRRAVAVLLLLASAPVAGYGLLYIAAVWTSDTSTTSLLTIGGLLLASAATLIAGALALLRSASR
jgi:hypothetical protein